MIVTILVLLIVVTALGGGGWGYRRYGWMGGAPTGLVFLVLALLYLTGHLFLR